MLALTSSSSSQRMLADFQLLKQQSSADRSIICVTEVPKEKEKEAGAEKIVAEIFPNLTKDKNLYKKDEQSSIG